MTTNYVNSVQRGTITIASGSTTGTATITAVTDTAWLRYCGATTTATTSRAQGTASIVLTNSTTVTATRKTSSTNTVIVSFEVIDADSTNLIKSIQPVSATFATDGTQNSTISAVTVANSAIFYLGHQSEVTTFNYGVDLPLWSLTSTTNAACIASSVTTGLIANAVVVEFQPGALNQATQFHSVHVPSAGSGTQTITSVNVNNSMIAYAGQDNTDDESSAENMMWATLTNATTVTITGGVNVGDPDLFYNFWAIEFVSGVLSQNAQRGSISIAAAASTNTATITSVPTALSTLNFTGWNTSNTATTTQATIEARIALTNATTVTNTLASAVPASKTSSAAWEVLSFNQGSVVVVTPIDLAQYPDILPGEINNKRMGQSNRGMTAFCPLPIPNAISPLTWLPHFPDTTRRMRVIPGEFEVEIIPLPNVAAPLITHALFPDYVPITQIRKRMTVNQGWYGTPINEFSNPIVVVAGNAIWFGSMF